MTNKESFNYTYSAREQEEIRNIRKKYTVQEKEEDKLEKVRRLDSSVTQKATVISLILGVMGALIMGAGMSLIMTDMGQLLHLGGIASVILGLFLGIAGILLVCFAYPVYIYTLKKERERVAPEIVRLTDELMK